MKFLEYIAKLWEKSEADILYDEYMTKKKRVGKLVCLFQKEKDEEQAARLCKIMKFAAEDAAEAYEKYKQKKKENK